MEGGERKNVKNWERKEYNQNVVYKILKKNRTIKQIGIRIVFYFSSTGVAFLTDIQKVFV